jgi:integrase
MAKDKLTDTAVKKAAPKLKPWKLSDGGGLYLEIMPNGSKYWRLKYRYAKKEKRLALGVYGTSQDAVSLASARKKAAIARDTLKQGTDPGEARKQESLARTIAAANSFEAVAQEWCAKERPHWSESHSKRTDMHLRNNLLPWLGARPIASITPPELLSVLRRTESKGTVETAHRAKQLASKIFRYAVVTGRAERDPSQDLKDALATHKKKHFAAITDPKQVGALLHAIDSYSGTPVVKAALQLSPLLFQRPGEIRQMQWEHIDFVNAEWRYLVTKTQTEHIVPLSRQALEILREIHPLTGGRGKFVFPSARGASRPMSDNGVRIALRTLGYDKDTMTPHGFRAMARTIMDEVMGYRTDWLEHQLAHKVKDVNGMAYNRTKHLEARKQMMQGWADYLDDLKAAAKSGNVVAGKFHKAG